MTAQTHNNGLECVLMATAAALEYQEFPLEAQHSATRTGMTDHEAGDAADFLAEFVANQGEFSVQSDITLDFNTIDRISLISRARELLEDQGVVMVTNYTPHEDIDRIRYDFETVCDAYSAHLARDQRFEDDKVRISPTSERLDSKTQAEMEKPLFRLRDGSDRGIISVFRIQRLLNPVNAKSLIQHLRSDFVRSVVDGYDGRNWNFSDGYTNAYINRSMIQTRGYHMDGLCGNMKAFLYLTDVESEADGPYCYARGTHKEAALAAVNQHLNSRLGWHELDFAFFDRRREIACLGERGTLIISDQSGSHHAHPQAEGAERIVAVQSIMAS